MLSNDRQAVGFGSAQLGLMDVSIKESWGLSNGGGGGMVECPTSPQVQEGRRWAETF